MTSLAGDTIFTAFCVVREFSTFRIAFQVTPLTILHPPHNSIKLHYYHRHLSVVAFCLVMELWAGKRIVIDNSHQTDHKKWCLSEQTSSSSVLAVCRLCFLTLELRVSHICMYREAGARRRVYFITPNTRVCKREAKNLGTAWERCQIQASAC